MTIKHIVVPITGNRDAHHLPLAALRLADTLNAHVSVTSTWMPQNLYLAPEIGLLPISYSALRESLAEIEAARHRLARQFFDQAVATTKTPIADTPVANTSMCARASTAWVDSAELERGATLTLGRLADLVVMDQPGQPDSFPEMQIFEDTVLRLHRPALIIPPSVSQVGRARAVIAWNGSTEAAKAVSAAVDLLAPGAVLTIVQAGVLRDGAPSAEDLATYLGWHCFETRVHCLPATHDIAALLLAEAKTADADMVIMGAYTHSQTREMIFGGVTAHMLAHADLPVLMAH
jgi:nucleotide-binding universal stress UspA family protein